MKKIISKFFLLVCSVFVFLACPMVTENDTNDSNDTNDTEQDNMNLVIEEPILSSNFVKTGQSSEIINISVSVTEENNAEADHVVITGSSITESLLVKDNGVWVGSFIPDCTGANSGSSLEFLITVSDTENLLIETRVFALSVTEVSSITLQLPTLGSASVPAHQNSESVSISVDVNESGMVDVSTVVVTGSSIGNIILNDSDGDDTWEGSLTPDVSLYDSGDSLDFTIIATDSVLSLSEDISFSLTVSAPTKGLFISEVADPASSDNQFIELYNASSRTIDFDNKVYYVVIQINGGSTYYQTQLSGSIAPDNTYVISSSNNTNFNIVYSVDPDLSNAQAAKGNGDDAYFLYKNGDRSSGTLIDILGEVDIDGTGTNWEYTNGHAVRLSSCTLSNAIWDSSEWDIQSGDTDIMTPGSH